MLRKMFLITLAFTVLAFGVATPLAGGPLKELYGVFNSAGEGSLFAKFGSGQIGPVDLSLLTTFNGKPGLVNFQGQLDLLDLTLDIPIVTSASVALTVVPDGKSFTLGELSIEATKDNLYGFNLKANAPIMNGLEFNFGGIELVVSTGTGIESIPVTLSASAAIGVPPSFLVNHVSVELKNETFFTTFTLVPSCSCQSITAGYRF